MLTLTLGQSSILVLALALWIGSHMARPLHSRAYVPLVALWITAVASKLFPILWAPAIVTLRAWRLLLGSMGAGALFLVVHLLFLPWISLYYMLDFLPRQTSAFVEPAYVDDQSLVAWLLRMTQPATVGASGFAAGDYQSFSWMPWWTVDPLWVRGAGALILICAGLWISGRFLRASKDNAEPMFHVWVLFSLLVLPHTERYNHVLLLPAMAWLWGQGERGRQVAVAAYFLAALSRLSHVWVQALPYPWAPLLTGSGPMAVILLIVGVFVLLGHTTQGRITKVSVHEGVS
jgi:alpha-1,2-mannosyltransferase